MAKKFELTDGGSFLWPSQCAVCGCLRTVNIKAHGSKLTGIGWWVLLFSIKYEKMSIEFPICKRHRLTYLISRFFYFVSFTGLLASVVLLPLFGFIVFLAVAAMPLAIFLSCYYLAPVRVWKSDKGIMTIKIRNEIYAQLFQRMNLINTNVEIAPAGFQRKYHMKIQCPNCKNAFNIADKMIPDAGTYVKCNNCDILFSINMDSGICPKCDNKIELNAQECPKCGVIYEIYQKYLQKKILEEESKIQRGIVIVDPNERILCSDESCIGTINQSGRCSQCGKIPDEEKNKALENNQFDKVQITNPDKPQSEVEEKPCPFCGKNGPTSAIRCKYCGKFKKKAKLSIENIRDEQAKEATISAIKTIRPGETHDWENILNKLPRVFQIDYSYALQLNNLLRNKGVQIRIEDGVDIKPLEENLDDSEIQKTLEKDDVKIKNMSEDVARIQEGTKTEEVLKAEKIFGLEKALKEAEVALNDAQGKLKNNIFDQLKPELPINPLPPDYFRVAGESFILYMSLIIFSTLLIALSSASMAILPILIIISAIVIKTKQGQLLGQLIKVSEHQLPDVYAASKKAASRLFMPIPDIFVTQNPVINAYAIGFFGKKSVVLNSKTVEAMTNEELIYILGHEFAHIKCNHTKWMVITSSTESVKIPILSSFFGFIFLFWSRKAEYTADRGGLIASKDLNASITALLKVAVGEKLVSQMDIHRILQQLEEGDVIHKLSEILGTHPYTLNRIQYLKDFYQSKTYNNGVCNMA